MELINKIRKSRKGFTLVEIIVVLVILAVLAAFTIPTMLGFVEDAKSKALIAEAREIYVAAQSTSSEFSLISNSTKIDSAILAVATNKDDETNQMRKYTKHDFTPVATIADAVNTSAGGKNAYWTVKITDGRVDSVTFIKDGHQILLTSGGTVTVVS